MNTHRNQTPWRSSSPNSWPTGASCAGTRSPGSCLAHHPPGSPAGRSGRGRGAAAGAGLPHETDGQAVYSLGRAGAALAASHLGIDRAGLTQAAATLARSDRSSCRHHPGRQRRAALASCGRPRPTPDIPWSPGTTTATCPTGSPARPAGRLAARPPGRLSDLPHPGPPPGRLRGSGPGHGDQPALGPAHPGLHRLSLQRAFPGPPWRALLSGAHGDHDRSAAWTTCWPRPAGRAAAASSGSPPSTC